MPVISTSFNRFLGVILGIIWVQSAAIAQLPRLSTEELAWLGGQIYQNECNGKYRCLTSWNSGEDFPSLGIGHFIWYQADQNTPFEETFPALLSYLQAENIELPHWLAEMPAFDSPWQSREQFIAEMDGEQLRSLRAFLDSTKPQQARFIALRLGKTRDKLMASSSRAEQVALESNFNAVLNSSPPFGIYALIDYLHFKGSGLKISERYQNQGWGLRDVLLAMKQSEDSLSEFVAAADLMLTQRVRNAPAERNEDRWLAGWRNRLSTYLPERQD